MNLSVTSKDASAGANGIENVPDTSDSSEDTTEPQVVEERESNGQSNTGSEDSESPLFGTENATELITFFHLDIEIWESQTRELKEEGYEITEKSCIHDDCNGTLYSGVGEDVCNNCSSTVGNDPSRWSGHNNKDNWEQFWAARPTYQSRHDRVVGSFPGPHDWVKSEDLDGSVDGIDPIEFYR